MLNSIKPIFSIVLLAILLIIFLTSTIFSASKFNTFNFFSSFPAFFSIINGSEDIIEVEGSNILICSPINPVEKLIIYMEKIGATHDADNDMGSRISFIQNNERFEMAVRINGYYALFTRV